MSIWFIGTGTFAALCLDELTQSGVVFDRIITGLPTRSGRNGKENPSPVELKALSLGLAVTRTGRLSENTELLSALEQENPSTIFVIDFGQIIREPFLSRLCLNIHPSLLPEYRGAAPIQRAILDGKTKTGVTVFRLAAKMDAGEILAQSEIEISPYDNASDLYPKLAKLGSSIAVKALANSELIFTPQDENNATYAPKIEKSDCKLDFDFLVDNFVNSVRALDMSGGAYVTISGKRLKIWRASAKIDGNNPVFNCKDGSVELIEVQPEGKRRMTGREWSAGLKMKDGTKIV
ncbi:MAG: methionyl-tRNA formyltransferase [Synergistaceae bacterium]|nr:methionyl-tRNA formyltransferase [Synergistaceae bacterium]